MRTLSCLVSGLSLVSLLAAIGCESAPAPAAEPPVLTVTSPMRSLVQGAAGTITVTGTAVPNETGEAISTVTVNDVPATIAADGSFTAAIEVQAGASFIHTVATAADGGQATDTRSVHAGPIQAAGSSIANAITAAISPNAFAKISGVAGKMIQQEDFATLLAPMQPMQHSGDENGPDCLYDELFVDDLTITGATIGLVPVSGGLAFSLELDGLDVPAHANYAVACVNGSEKVEVTADKVVVTGTLLVTPNGTAGFTTTLQSPNVALTNFHLDAGGVPGEILDMIDMDNTIGSIISFAAEKFMGPMMNSALGGLAGVKQVNVLGKTLDVSISPNTLTFDPTGATVSLASTLMIEGAESAPGFVFTDNGTPTMSPGQGLELGMADDLANEALDECTALGMLTLSMPTPGGTFDTVAFSMTTPPMISADPSDGQMRLYLGDMKMLFTLAGTPVADAYMNAKVDLSVATANNGYGVAVQLGTPDINVDVATDIPNATHLEDEDLSAAVKLGLGAQIATISLLLGGIPLPSVEGLKLSDVSVVADDGYVMVAATLN